MLLLKIIRKLKEDHSQQVTALVRENCALNSKIRALRLNLKRERERKTQATSVADDLLKSDRDVSLLTGVPSKLLFREIHRKVAPLIERRWQGLKQHAKQGLKRFKKISGPQRKLNSKDELLLTLMRLRLGLVNYDLARRFGISAGLCSRIFHAWLSALNSVVGRFVQWAPKELVNTTMPARYRHSSDLRCIIDCTEVFIETPKDLFLQSVTWSDYKHHNTGKILIGVAPNSMITYVSRVYGGRVSDKELTMTSGFLDLLEPHDMLQADKGFLIENECAERLVSLQIPPGKRGKAQMTSASVQKTKRIANLRIIVEQVIRRIKVFRILKYELPISLVPQIDAIVDVCAGLCNLQKPIYSS